MNNCNDDNKMRVLVGCEFSQTVTRAFRELGHEAYSCDVLPTEGNPEWHIQGDVLDILYDGWDMIIAHPPCTYLANSGVRWLYNKDGTLNIDRWEKMHDACIFFNEFIRYPLSKCDKIVIENPIMHKHAMNYINVKYDQIIQPWQFGHGETKSTCLWLRGLPKLKPTCIVDGRENRIHQMTPSKTRSVDRSRTYTGIAKAMAEQWGGKV